MAKTYTTNDYNKAVSTLAELRKQLSSEKDYTVSGEILENVCDYCESMGIYDKLGNYGDFYYKIKTILNRV